MNSNEILTISKIADELNASNKTIRNDLSYVEKLLDENHLKLVKKTGIGIYVEGEERDKLKVLSLIKAYKLMGSQYTSGDRQLYILNQLLKQNKKNTISSLQNELFISRPSIYKDLEKVKEWLMQRHIKLMCDKKEGFILLAGEKRIRKAMFDFFCYSEEYDAAMNNIETLQELGKGYASLNFFSYEQKEDFLDVNMKQVEAFIKELEEKIQVKFTMTDLLRLTIKYAIAISRMKKGHYASIKEQTLKDLKALNKFHSLEEIREGMIIQFQLDQLPDAELAYLFGITIVAKTHFEDTVWNINKKMMVINKIVAQEIIELTRENYHIDNEITFF